MPDSKLPYDPQPERHDAFGELAREGYNVVPGDHETRLKSLQERIGNTNSGIRSEAVVKNMRPKRWLAIAAGIAVLLIAGLTAYLYDSPEQKIAKVVLEEPAASQSQGPLKDQDSPEVAEEQSEVPTAAEDLGIATQPRSAPLKNAGPPKDDKSAHNTPRQVIAASEPLAFPSSPEKEKLTEEAADLGEEQESGQVALFEQQDEEPPSPQPSVPANKDEATLNAEQSKMKKAADESSAAVNKRVSSFHLERSAAAEMREVTGEVVEPSGAPVIGASITIEETGQQVLTNQMGEFSILLTDEAVVGEVSAEGYISFLFDVTAGQEYRIFLPRISSSLPSAQIKGKSISLRIIAPKAEPNAAFDEYTAQQTSTFTGEKVVVQFDVNRFGRPRQILSGPGKQNRDAVKLVKDWLKNGPNWPESYQRKSWRYTIVMP